VKLFEASYEMTVNPLTCLGLPVIRPLTRDEKIVKAVLSVALSLGGAIGDFISV